MILTLLFALMIALFFSTRSTVKLGSSRINREADGYESMLNGWIGERQGVVKMMTGLLSTHPAMLEAGATDFIKKPFVPRVLLTRVRRIVELNRLQNHLEEQVREQTRAVVEKQK